MRQYDRGFKASKAKRLRTSYKRQGIKNPRMEMDSFNRRDAVREAYNAS